MEMQIMKRILSLIVSLGLVFSAHGHSISDYVMAATPGTGDDGTLLRMLTEDSGLNNVAIVEAGLLAKGGFEYQDVIAMPFDIKQQRLQESIATGSPLMVDPGLGAFSAGGASEGDSLGGVLPATFYEPATVAYVSSLPADWGVAITDANNLAELEAFLFAQASIYRGNYAALTAATLGEKIHEMLRITGSLPPDIVEVVEPVVVPTPLVAAVGGDAGEPSYWTPNYDFGDDHENATLVVNYIISNSPGSALLDAAQIAKIGAAANTKFLQIKPMVTQGKDVSEIMTALTTGKGAILGTSAATTSVPAPVVVPTPAPTAGGAAAERIIAYLGDKLNGAEQANLRTYSDADLVGFTDMIDQKRTPMTVKMRLGTLIITPAAPAPVVVPTPTPAVPAPTPAVVPAPTPAVGARPNMSSILEAGQGKKLRSAKDRVLKPLPLLAPKPAASAAVSAPKPSMQGLLLGMANRFGTAGRKPEDVYADNIIGYVKEALDEDKKFTKEEKRLIRDLDTELLSQYSAEIDRLKKIMDAEITLDFKKQLIRDLPSLPKRVVSVATAPAVSGGGMGAPAPMPMPLPVPRPGGMGVPAPMPMPLPAPSGAATGVPRPMLPPPPAGPRPTPIVTTPPAPAASAASSGSVSPSGMSDEAKLLIRDGLISDENLIGPSLEVFNGFVTNWLSSGTRGSFDLAQSVFKTSKIDSASNLEKAKAKFLIAIGQTTGISPLDLARWKTKLGLA